MRAIGAEDSAWHASCLCFICPDWKSIHGDYEVYAANDRYRPRRQRFSRSWPVAPLAILWDRLNMTALSKLHPSQMFSTFKKLLAAARMDTAIDSSQPASPGRACATHRRPSCPRRAGPVAPRRAARQGSGKFEPAAACHSRPPPARSYATDTSNGCWESGNFHSHAKVLAQIGQGSVKISFGELRAAALAGIFSLGE